MRKGDYMLMARANDEMPRTHGVTDKDMEFIKTINPEYFELYNVANDAGQQEDLSTIEPEKLEEMKSAMFTLLEEVKEEGPNWEGLPIYEEKKANHNKPEEFKRNQKRFLMEGE